MYRLNVVFGLIHSLVGFALNEHFCANVIFETTLHAHCDYM